MRLTSARSSLFENLLFTVRKREDSQPLFVVLPGFVDESCVPPVVDLHLEQEAERDQS
jgi:hypothetical protein